MYGKVLLEELEKEGIEESDYWNLLKMIYRCAWEIEKYMQ